MVAFKASLMVCSLTMSNVDFRYYLDGCVSIMKDRVAHTCVHPSMRTFNRAQPGLMLLNILSHLNLVVLVCYRATVKQKKIRGVLMASSWWLDGSSLLVRLVCWFHCHHGQNAAGTNVGKLSGAWSSPGVSKLAALGAQVHVMCR
jgi:hypothetical protein